MFDLDPTYLVVTGLLTGVIFGFLLQRAHVTRYQVILGQFLLKDFTVLKVMLTAIIVGGIGIWAMQAAGAGFPMHIKGATLAANALGGAIFAIGMVILGYCPGTGAAALGDGSRHAWFGILGMVAGGAIFAETFPLLSSNIMKWATVTHDGSSKVTLPELTGVSPWWYFAGLVVIALVVFYLIERYEHRPKAV